MIPSRKHWMRNLQLHLFQDWDRQLLEEHFPVSWTTAIHMDLWWWLDADNLRTGQSLQRASPNLCMHTDTSMDRWGALVLHKSTSGLWSPLEKSLNINLLELRAIRLSLKHFSALTQVETVTVFPNKATALSYLAKNGGTCSSSFNKEAQDTLTWAEAHSIRLLTQYVWGSSNVLADCLSRYAQVIHKMYSTSGGMQYTLEIMELSHSGPVATRLNFRLPNFISPFKDHMAIAMDTLFNWDHHDLYALPPLPLVRKALNNSRSVGEHVDYHHSSLPAEGMVSSPVTGDNHHSQSAATMQEPPAPTSHPSLPPSSPCTSSSCMETVR